MKRSISQGAQGQLRRLLESPTLRGLCSDHPQPDIFFADKGPEAQAAKTICRQCPVQQECLDFALEAKEDIGVWGGTTPTERRRMNGNRPGGDGSDISFSHLSSLSGGLSNG